MSNKERVIQLLDDIPSYKMGYVLAYVQGVAADEEADDAFCADMVKRYLDDPDEEEYTLEECKKEWDVS